MPYKMVIDIGKLCGSLAGAAAKHSDLITGSLAEHWRDKLPEGQEIPNILQVQTWVGEDLRQIHGELSTASRQLNKDLTEDRKGRGVRDSLLARSREELIAARRIFEVIYGAGGSDAFFEEPGTQVALDPATVHEQTVVVLGNLTDPDFVPPPLRVDIGVDLSKIAERLAGPSKELGEALAELNLTTHGTNASFESKEMAFTKLQRQALFGARLLEAVYAYAGHEGISTRTRKSKHALKEATPELGGSEPAAGGEPSSGVPPSGESPSGESPSGEPEDQDGADTAGTSPGAATEMPSGTAPAGQPPAETPTPSPRSGPPLAEVVLTRERPGS